MRFKITPKAILIPTVSLFLICLVVTAVLALTNSVTAEQISANEQASKEQSMQNVCPGAASFEELIPDVMYEGKTDSGDTVGYAISTVSQGYGGQVKVMTGIIDGKIIAVDVFYNDDETPGLGKNTSNASFRDQYKGLNTLEDIAVSKDNAAGSAQTVDAVTSATISSRAVTRAVNEACGIYNEQIGGDFSIGEWADMTPEEFAAAVEEAGLKGDSLGIIGGADGPTAVFITSDTEKEGE